MGLAQSVMDAVNDYGDELAHLSFAVAGAVGAWFGHAQAHAIYGPGTPMDEVLAVSGFMAAYFGLGFLVQAATERTDYLPIWGGLGALAGAAVHYGSHVYGYQVPFVGDVMAFTAFAGYYANLLIRE